MLSKKDKEIGQQNTLATLDRIRTLKSVLRREFVSLGIVKKEFRIFSEEEVESMIDEQEEN